MKKTHKSYLVHFCVWIFLSILSLFSKILAMIPIAIIFIPSILSYQFLAFLTGATDPLYMMKDGTHIPNIAWNLWNLFWFFLALSGIIYAIILRRRGNNIGIIMLLHIIIFIVGFFLLAFSSAINYPFQL